MEPQVSRESAVLSPADVIVSANRQGKDGGALRPVGFHRFVIPVDGQRMSDGSSTLYEIGYCLMGQIRLSSSRLEEGPPFVATAGDFFFLPAGQPYNLTNCGDVPATLIIACTGSRLDLLTLSPDGWNFSERPFTEGQHPNLTVHAKQSWIGSLCGVDQGDVDGHVVLYYDTQHRTDRQNLVGDLFPIKLLSREFGIPETQVPELYFELFDPLVIRPVPSEAPNE